MTETLEIEAKPGESEGVKSWTFTLLDDDSVAVTENWISEKDFYGNGFMIQIPARVWAEALYWIEDPDCVRVPRLTTAQLRAAADALHKDASKP